LSVSAAGFVPCTGTGAGGTTKCDVCQIFELITNIYNYMVKIIMPILAGLLFLWGGIMMVMAGASEESYKKGKAIFVNTAIGVVIVLISWLAVNTILVEFARSANGFSSGSWWQGVKCQ
jgi:hypothetical protein